VVGQDGERHDDARIDPELQRNKERIAWREILELQIGVIVGDANWIYEEFQDVEPPHEPESKNGRDDDRDHRPQNAPTKLLEVIEERHFSADFAYR